MADFDLEAARLAADRINGLLGESRVTPWCLRVEHLEEVRSFLQGLDVCASAVPYRLNLAPAREAVARPDRRMESGSYSSRTSSGNANAT